MEIFSIYYLYEIYQSGMVMIYELHPEHTRFTKVLDPLFICEDACKQVSRKDTQAII